MLNASDPSLTDSYITDDIGQVPAYQKIATVRYSGGYYTVWAYVPGTSRGHR
jgi:hypothetical protein